MLRVDAVMAEIEPDVRSEMQDRIIRALRWTGIAADSGSRAVVTVALVTALESLLLQPHETSR